MKTKKINTFNYVVEIDIESQAGFFASRKNSDCDSGSFDMIDDEIVELNNCKILPLEIASKMQKIGFKIDTKTFCIIN